ncbi:hypothetical protein D9M68_837680 [compost metagenome]
MGQALGSSDAGDHPQAQFWQAEAGVVGGVDEVAHQRQLAAAAQGVAGHCGDDRLAPVADAVGGGEEVLEVDLRVLLVGHLLDVRPGGEGLGRAGDDQAADPGVGFQAVQRLVEFGDQLAVQRVERLRPVQGDQADALAHLDQQGFVVHGRFPGGAGARGAGPGGHFRVMVVFTAPTSSSSSQRSVTVLVWV